MLSHLGSVLPGRRKDASSCREVGKLKEDVFLCSSCRAVFKLRVARIPRRCLFSSPVQLWVQRIWRFRGLAFFFQL